MHRTKRLLFAAGLILLAACDEPTGIREPAPDIEFSQHGAHGASEGRIRVMTRNLYVGADVDAVIGALASSDPTDDLPALQAAIATLQATDYPDRARAIAREIDETRPAFVGLQEVYQLKVDLTAIGVPVNIDMDFLQVLRDALAARHLRYDVAARVQNTNAAPFPGISLVDFDVVLVDHDQVRVGPGTIARQYSLNIGPVAPGVDIRRGYIVIRATVDGRSVTFANTHLESGSDPAIGQLRAGQAQELAAVLAGASPVILTGDLNDTPASPMYQVLSGAGLRDTWLLLGDGSAGLTCCNLPDLSNAVPSFDQRIDYVWERGLERPHERLEGDDFLVGVRRHERISGPAGLIWPSDHAGLVAEMKPSKR